MEQKKDEFEIPRVCHITQEARDLCRRQRLYPSDMIVWQDLELHGKKLEDLKEVQEAMRQVVQVEGVMIHEKQKGFFRDLFSGMLKALVELGK